MALKESNAGDVNLSGSLTKLKGVDYDLEPNPALLDEFHLRNIGKLIEEIEGELRNQLDAIYVGKTKENLFTNRSIGTYDLEKGK